MDGRSDPPGFRAETRVAIEAVSNVLPAAARPVDSAGLVSKGQRDLVTATDVAIEDAVRALLAKALAFPVVGEERGGEPPSDGSPYWLLDPLCGTRNYASGVPLYCINLALVEDGRVTASVVGEPSAGQLYVAELGAGAWTMRDGVTVPLAVAEDSRTIVIEEGKSKGERREAAARLIAAAIRADRWDIRAFGSTVAFPYLASGGIAAYAVSWVTVVHAAAGTLVATEAGAVVTDLDGAPWSLQSESLLAAATPELHRELLRLAQELE